MENIFSLQKSLPAKCVIRKTGEIVEVIAYNVTNYGERNALDLDWVTYIDSNGNEHIKENLNFDLDFRYKDDNIMNVYNNLIQKIVKVENQRLFDVAEKLVLNGYNVDDAISIAEDLVSKIKVEYQ